MRRVDFLASLWIGLPAIGAPFSACTPVGECEENNDVTVFSEDYVIDAVTVSGPCSPLHACNALAFASSFCGTYIGAPAMLPSCTFAITFHDKSGPGLNCTIAAERGNYCGEPADVKVMAIKIDGGVPKCFDAANDPMLRRASTATALDAGSE
jgi:hypothetical protein